MALTDSLISYWKLDSNTSPEPDAVGSNDATVSGATYTASGKINGGYDFDGTNDFLKNGIDSENINDPDDGDFTFTCWFKTDVTDTRLSIMDSGALGGGKLGAGLEVNSTNDLRFIIRTAAKRYDIDGSSTLTSGTWYFLVASWDQSTTTLTAYINNSEELNSSTSTNVVNSGAYEMHIGCNTVETIFFNGIIDECALWSRVLTSDERTSLYNSGTGLQYPFGESAGTNMQINIGDSWKVVEGMKINIGDSWKTVESVQQNIGDSWKTVF